jgi:PAS domain S-box-containing protein
MNWVEFAWAVMGGASLTLGLIHLVVWLRARSRPAHLMFFILAIAVAAFSAIEVSLMRAQSPADYAVVARWAHVPIAVIVLSIIGFVHFYFDAGRAWLAYAAVAVRLLTLAINFTTRVSINYQEITSLSHVILWGGAVATVPIAVPNPLQIIAQIGNILLVAYVVDASITLWRRGDPVARRRAVVVGGALALCIGVVSVLAFLITTGELRSPTFLTPGFLVVVLAMGYELSWDVIAAGQLAAKLRSSEQSLRTSEERSRAVVEAAPNAILLVDGEGRIALTNPQANALFGYAREELVGMAVDLLVPARYRVSHESHRRSYAGHALARAMGAEREIYALNKDGGEVPVEVTLRPMRTATGEFVLASLVDVTERRRMERMAARQRDEIAHLSRVAFLGELSGSLAHELNQPLTAILSNAQAAQRLLARTPPAIDGLGEILTDIVKNDRRAGEVIERLRSMLRKEDAHRQVLSINDVVQESLRLMHSDLLNRHVTVRTDLAEDLPPVTGDRVQMQQVLLNLVVNGCDAMDGRERDRHLLVRSRAAEGGCIEIAITDHGEGIPAQDLERIFEAFVTTKSHGIGLGLAICRSIAESHGGRLWATNNSECGATFHLQLPARAD